MMKQPFGKPFTYTDSTELPIISTKHELRGLPWYKKIFKKKPPMAWVVPDGEEPPTADLLKLNEGSGEVRVSQVEPRVIIPVYKEDTVVDLCDLEDKDGNES